MLSRFPGAFATRRAYSSRLPFCTADAVRVSRTMLPYASFSTRIRSDTGRESQFVPAMSRLLKAILLVLRKLLRMLSRPAETRSPKSGRTVLSESISTCCERICWASTPALRDAAAVSESRGSGAANESVRSPEVSPARVAAVSVPNVTFVRRMRSVRFLLRITMLSSVRRAAMPPASEAEASASSANDPPICSGVIPMSARSKSKTLPDTPIRCSRSVSVPETDSSRRSASSRS